MQFTSSGAEFAVGSTTTGNQRFSDVTALSTAQGAAAGFVAVWQDSTDTIRGQRMTPDGAETGDEFTVNTPSDALIQEKPAVASLEGGGFVVAWRNFQSGIVAQRFDASGAKLGESVLVNDAAEAFQDKPTVAGLAGGGFAVTWEGRTVQNGPGNIFSQLFDATGAKTGGEQALTATNTSFGSLNSATAALGTGYLSVWQDNSQIATKIVGQAFTASGEKSGESFTIATSGNFVGSPVATALKDGGHVAAWVFSPSPGTFGIAAQRFGADGATAGGQVEVAASGADFTALPDIAALPDGGFAVSWQAQNATTSDNDVFARAFTADGTAAGAAFRLNADSVGQQTYAEIAAGKNGQLLAIWTEQKAAGADFDIEGQAFASDFDAPGKKPLQLAGDLKAGVAAGGTYTLTAKDLGTVDATGAVSYVVSGVSGGRVQLKGTDKAVSTFTQADLAAGEVVFVQSGSSKTVAFSVAAKDDDETTAPKAFSLSVKKTGLDPSKVLAPKYDGGDHLVQEFETPWLQVVRLAEGRSIAIWNDSPNLRAQMLDEEGHASGDVMQLTRGISSGPFNAVALAGGRFAVTYGSSTANEKLVALVFDKSGKILKKQVISEDLALFNSTDATADGGFVTTWQQDKFGGPDDLYFQRFNSTGNKIGGPVKVATSPSGTMGGNEVDILSDGRFVVTWKDGDIVSFGKGIGPAPQYFAQIFAKEGVRLGDVFAVSPTKPTPTGITTLPMKDGGVAFVVRSDKDRIVDLRIQDKDGTSYVRPFTSKPDNAFSTLVEVRKIPDGFLTIWIGLDGAQIAQLYDAAFREVGGKFSLRDVGALKGTLSFHGRDVADLSDDELIWAFSETAVTSKFSSSGELDGETKFIKGGLQPWFASNVYSIQNLMAGDGKGNGITGTSGDDRILGLGGKDTLKGQGGDDVLIGGSGDDRLVGGAGTDVASYSNASDGIGLNLERASANSGDADGDSFESIERFVGSKHTDFMRGADKDDHFDGLAGNDFLFGRGGDDRLAGGYGDDVLEGGKGADELLGALGLDAASYSEAASGVVASLAKPRDNTGEAKGDRYVAVESLIGSAFDDTLTGNSTENRLDGGRGDDTLFGRDGVDYLFGGDGDDVLVGGGGHDLLDGGKGKDTISYDDALPTQGRTGYFVLLNTNSDNEDFPARDDQKGIENIVGSRYDDELYGDKGANEITGGLGADKLSGADFDDRETAADTFIYRNVRESGLSKGERDKIEEFGANDRIDIQAVTAKGFSFADDIKQTKSNSSAFLVEINADGKGGFDMAIEVSGISKALTADDFIL